LPTKSHSETVGRVMVNQMALLLLG